MTSTHPRVCFRRIAPWAAAAGALVLLGGAASPDPDRPHSFCDPTHRDPTGRLLVIDCSFRGFGHFTIEATAKIRDGKAPEQANFSIVNDGKPCSTPVGPTTLSDRVTLRASCDDISARDKERFSLVIDDPGTHRVSTRVQVKRR